jgi:ABC-2 type transport system ATP-binding protein
MYDYSLPIYTEDLQKIYYPEKVVLEGINLTVVEGETIGILGNNGAGKTTLLRIFGTLLAPSYGELKIFGLDPRFEASRIKRMIGYLPERFSFYPYYTVNDILEFFMHLNEENSTDPEEQREQVIRSLNIESYLNYKIKSLSKGMLHKVGLAVTLMHNPALLLLDEPTSGLDPLMRIEVRKMLINLTEDFKKTTLISSHILEDIEAVCDRVFILEKGQMLHEPFWISELKTKILKMQRLEIRSTKPNELVHTLKKIEGILYRVLNPRGAEVYCKKDDIGWIREQLEESNKNGFTVLSYPITLEDIYILNHAKIEWVDFLS